MQMYVFWPLRKYALTAWSVLFVLRILTLSTAATAQTLDERLRAEPAAQLATAARKEGDPARGAAVFFARAMACSTCHSVGDRADSIGPDLTKLSKQTTDASFVESVLEPSKVIAPGYATVSVETADGRTLSGLPLQDTAEQLVLRDAEHPETPIRIKVSDIVERRTTKESTMPAGQINQLSDRRQFLDLVRFLIEVRDGGRQRALDLMPAPEAHALKVPEDPLPWQPVVQRGDVSVEGNARYTRGVALGFSGGTVLFDADQLGTAAVWHDGFVKSSPQNYFGLFWHRSGGAPEVVKLDPHLLRFKLSAQEDWQFFEPPKKSDPNTGSRFAGYQIGKSTIRLRYHLRVGNVRMGVTEDVRAETRPQWQGFARQFQFDGLPEGAQVELKLPAGTSYEYYNTRGEKLPNKEEAGRASLLAYRTDRDLRVARVPASHGATWVIEGSPGKSVGLVSAPAKKDSPLQLRIDLWKRPIADATPSAADLTALDAQAPVLDDAFDVGVKASPLPPAPIVGPPVVVTRPAVNPHNNIDEFPTASGRFLRFVVTRTNDGTAPGLDELEVYGADPKLNLALSGKASASSMIGGHAIHQIPHLNDGKLGNPHSWISNEAGAGWAQIEFPATVDIRRIVWARDRTGTCKDRLAITYRILVSADGVQWSQVGSEKGRAFPAGFRGDAWNRPIPGGIGAVRRDATPGYELEEIPSPFPSCRPSGIAFSPDGVMYVIAMTEGQVWRTRVPPAGQPEHVRWERFAAGLNHPIGITIVDGRIYVAQKPEITELIDRDGDGVADHYRTVATGWGLSTGWHEYTFGLAADPQKNLWFALNTGTFNPANDFVRPGRWRGSILRIQHGTERLEEMATGCRVPNGIAQCGNGDLFFTDNQGDYIPVCKVAPIVPTRFYGHMEDRAVELPSGTYPSGLAAVWLPYHVIRSVSGPVHDATQGKFGPFADQIFVGDAGYGANPNIVRVALEKVDGEYQGACFRFIDGQPLGCERMQFGPDNQLYMASLTSGLTRLKFNGKTPPAMRCVNIRPGGKGVVVQLTRPLAADSKLSADTVRVKRWHYNYWRTYGSPPVGVKSVPVERAEVSGDRTAITLTFPVETYPTGMVYEINLGALTAEGGEKLLHNEAWYTVQRIPK